MKDCFALRKTCPSLNECLQVSKNEYHVLLVDHVFISSSPWWEIMEQIWTNDIGTRSCDCVDHATLSKPSKILFDLEANTRNQGERYFNTSGHKIRRLTVRKELNSTQDSEILGGFCWLFFFSLKTDLGWFLGDGETNCVNSENFSFLFQEKFLFILSYAKFMVHLLYQYWTICQPYVFRTWLIENFPSSCARVTHTEQKNPLARTGIALCWHKLIHFQLKKQVSFHLG